MVLIESPRVKFVVAVRDPVEQFVAFYNNFHLRSGFELPNLWKLAVAVGEYRRTGHHLGLHQPQWGPLYETVLHALFNFAGRFAEPLAWMRELLGDSRLHVVHLDEFLGSNAAATRNFHRLLQFMGIGPEVEVPRLQSPDLFFPRENRGMGCLCGPNSSARVLRRILLDMLYEEYEALYSLGAQFQHLHRGPCEPIRP